MGFRKKKKNMKRFVFAIMFPDFLWFGNRYGMYHSRIQPDNQDKLMRCDENAFSFPGSVSSKKLCPRMIATPSLRNMH